MSEQVDMQLGRAITRLLAKVTDGELLAEVRRLREAGDHEAARALLKWLNGRGA